MRGQPRKLIETLEVQTRAEWRKWLAKHHDSNREIWLIFWKRHTGKPSLDHEDAVEEALCFGWIDSIVRRLNDAQYALKFTPRKADSKWSALNRRRYAELRSRGLMAAPGLARCPGDRYAIKPPRRLVIALPASFEEELKKNRRAWENLQKLAPSYRRAYIGWITTAKREKTKEKRLREAIERLARGEKLGLK